MGGELIKETDAFMAFVDSLVADKESDELEFKSAFGGFPRSLWETYSSFANTDGGIIILGVSEKKGDFKIEGIPIEDAIQYKKEFWDNVNNTSKVSINLMKDSDVSIEKYNDKCLLVLRVPRADATQKPAYIASGVGRGTTYQLKRNATLAPNIETLAQENQSGAYYVSNTATLSGNRMDEHESPEQRKKKMARVELEDLIIKNCSEFITIEELSRKVGRTISYLRTGVLKKMVAEKKLQMLFPGKPHHPNQKYKVSD